MMCGVGRKDSDGTTFRKSVDGVLVRVGVARRSLGREWLKRAVHVLVDAGNVLVKVSINGVPFVTRSGDGELADEAATPAKDERGDASSSKSSLSTQMLSEAD
jgi:hypothetical protein